MHRQRIRGIYTLLLIMAAGGILIYSGQAGSGKKTEEYPAVSWIEAQEKENVKAIEAKLAAKETAEQETEAGTADKGSVVERFEGAVLVGDSGRRLLVLIDVYGFDGLILHGHHEFLVGHLLAE